MEAFGSRGEDVGRGKYETVLEFGGDEGDADVDVDGECMKIYIMVDVYVDI